MDNINDILRAKRIVRQNGYKIEKPERDYDYEREDRMNLIRAKRIVKDAGYSYSKPTYNTGVSDNNDDYAEFDDVPRQRFQRTGVDRPRKRFLNDEPDEVFPDAPAPERPFQGRGRFIKKNPNVPDNDNPPPQNTDNDVPPQPRRVPRERLTQRQRPVNNVPPKANAPAENPAPATEAPVQTQEEPRQKTRQEIYADIAAKYV